METENKRKSQQLYFDNYGNIATLEERMTLPYREAKSRTKAFVLSLYALYDDNMLYFRSVYENKSAALEKLKNFSCGEWEEVTDV